MKRCRLGRSGPKCRMFCMDWGDASRIMALTMQKYVCFQMGGERFARGVNARAKYKSKMRGVFAPLRMTSKRRGDDNRSEMGRSTSAPLMFGAGGTRR
jgi:hypothetical protein